MRFDDLGDFIGLILILALGFIALGDTVAATTEKRKLTVLQTVASNTTVGENKAE